MLEWNRSNEHLPEPGEDILGFNEETFQIEFGFRSFVDSDPLHWVDFSYPVTHWAYAKWPDDAD